MDAIPIQQLLGQGMSRFHAGDLSMARWTPEVSPPCTIFAGLLNKEFNWLNSIASSKVTDNKMTKADLVSRISEKTGIERQDVQATVEAFMESVRGSLESGHNVYLRGFGSFVIKRRAKKTGRDILKNKTIEIPAHNIPSFKPAKSFMENVKTKVSAN